MYKPHLCEYHGFNNEESSFTVFKLYLNQEWSSKYGVSNGACKGAGHNVEMLGSK